MDDSASALRRWQVISTLGILALSVASSLLGLFQPGHYADPSLVIDRLRAQDAVVLAVAVPVLAAGLWLAARGSLRGRIVWLGALAYMTYLWASVTVQTAFNQFYLGYVVLLGLSVFTLVGGVLDTDADVLAARLTGRLSRSLFAGWLALVAVGLAALWLSSLVPATLTGTAPPVVEELGESALHTYVLDLAIVVPSLAVAAVWLQRGHAWGYVTAGVLLVMAAILAPGLTAITVVDVQSDAVTITPLLLVGTILPPMVSIAFAARYLLAVDGRPPDGSTTAANTSS